MTHVAHINWSVLRAPAGDPLVAEFYDAVGRVNAIAERSPGFVWRHGAEDTAGRAIGWPMFVDNPTMIASFSVWQSVDDFRHFVENTVHGAFLKRGAEWFDHGVTMGHVLWWVPEGHIPTIEDARRAVDRLAAEGAGAEVFTMRAAPTPPIS